MPQLDDSDAMDRLRLIRSRRVGAVTFHRLMAEHGTAAAALAALPGIAAAAGVENYAPCPIEVVRHEMAQARIAGAVMLLHGGRAIRRLWAILPMRRPCFGPRAIRICWRGPGVALVGARNASSLGLRMARRLGTALGEAGQVVVSGLARGIDAEAHAAALPTGTVAVMAGGVDVIYPEENAKLAAEIAQRGCLVSEQPMGMVPQARHFPLRNRLIAGLSRAVVVVEAAARSGSLITARDALDLGRDVLAVPGHPFDARAAGCNMLIRDGAVLVQGAADVLAAIGVPQVRVVPDCEVVHAPEAAVTPQVPLTVPVPGAKVRTLADMAGLHLQILARLGPSPTAEDQLIRDLALPAAAVAPELVALEMDGKIARQAGGLLSRM